MPDLNYKKVIVFCCKRPRKTFSILNKICHGFLIEIHRGFIKAGKVLQLKYSIK
jgi:hypothetical protein